MPNSRVVLQYLPTIPVAAVAVDAVPKLERTRRAQGGAVGRYGLDEREHSNVDVGGYGGK